MVNIAGKLLTNKLGVNYRRQLRLLTIDEPLGDGLVNSSPGERLILLPGFPIDFHVLISFKERFFF